MKTRQEAFRSIENNAFDVCVVGGGATGAGCALDAQLRGLRTVLLEGGDFASGTSSASTKIVHGGRPLLAGSSDSPGHPSVSGGEAGSSRAHPHATERAVPHAFFGISRPLLQLVRCALLRHRNEDLRPDGGARRLVPEPIHFPRGGSQSFSVSEK